MRRFKILYLFDRNNTFILKSVNLTLGVLITFIGTSCGKKEVLPKPPSPDIINICDRGALLGDEIAKSAESSSCQNVSLLSLSKVQNFGLHDIPIFELTEASFEHMENLETIVLSKAKLDKIHPKAFSRLKKLTVLIIKNNPLEILPDQLFNGLEELSWLELVGNNIQDLPIGIFENTPSLYELDLSENNIRSIRPNLFSNLKSLITLKLTANDIVEINKDTFSGLTSLRYLQLGMNQLEKISDTAFDDLNALRVLSLPESYSGNKDLIIANDFQVWWR
jgi:Leucine-rich repeat (LRR) protein